MHYFLKGSLKKTTTVESRRHARIIYHLELRNEIQLSLNYCFGLEMQQSLLPNLSTIINYTHKSKVLWRVLLQVPVKLPECANKIKIERFWTQFTTHLRSSLLSNSENREHLQNFRDVDCVLANQNKVQEGRANLKTTN